MEKITGTALEVELQELLRERGLSQKDLAAFLGLTPAAVSYLLHGKIAISGAQLDDFLVFIHADSALLERMENFRVRLRNAYHGRRPPENLSRLLCRCRSGLNLDTVALRSGISAERIALLEQEPEAFPTPEEVDQLKAVYNCEAGLLWGTGENAPAEVLLKAAEGTVSGDSSGKVLVSVMDSAALCRYRQELDAELFFRTKRISTEEIEVSSESGSPAASVEFSTARLGMDIPGTVELFLGLPDKSFPPGLYLGRGKHGIFRLWEHKGWRWRVWKAAAAPRGVGRSALWYIPVISFTFHPGKKLQEK